MPRPTGYAAPMLTRSLVLKSMLVALAASALLGLAAIFLDSALANRILQRIDGEGKPVNLDVAGAGEARERRLQRLAERLADSVAEHGLEARIYGMNPKDRRSMHVALQSMNTIQTFSEDEGIARRLVITRR